MEVPDSVQVFSDKYLENISEAFKALYNEEQLSDVTIYCKEGSLKAHKLILAANSPYFCKIFRENRNEFPILILQGTSLNQMKNLIDLLYNGVTDVKHDDVQGLNRLVREFEIKGVNFGAKSTSSNVRLEIINSIVPEGVHNRDTRFKGKKRVAVDYEHEENLQTNLPCTSRSDMNEMNLPKRPHNDIIQPEETTFVKREIVSPVPTESSAFSSDVNSRSGRSSYGAGSESKLTAWAKKQRKFKCDLCPSSFKRSSHLSRHQLVHTGERPYSCDRCEKAFSRHDKLKSHMRKTHEFIPDSMYERIDNDQVDSESESSVRNHSPHQNGSENGVSAEYVDLTATENGQRNASPLFTISHISSILEDSFVSPTKKGRGRPRKYPPHTPAVLNSNQEPVSNYMKEKTKRRRKSWIDVFMTENENKKTSLRLRERTNVNNNEDFMFAQMVNDTDKDLMCQICEKTYIYQKRLDLHMKKIHGITNYLSEENMDSISLQQDETETSPAIPGVSALHMEGEQSSEVATESSKSTEKQLSYEQLRRLLPKECSLRPILAEQASNPKPNETIVCSAISTDRGTVVEIGRSPVDCVTSTSIVKQDITQDFPRKSKKPRRIKSKKRRKRGIVRYARSLKKKTRDFPNISEQKDEEYSELSSRNPLQNILDNCPELVENQVSPFNMPILNPAIEISIVNPENKNSSTKVLSLNKNDNESNLINEISEQHNSTVEDGGDVFKNVSPISNPSEKVSEFPQKRKRGRPRKNAMVPPPVKRGRGRPRGHVFMSRPEVQNYNLSNLPYGDLSYLTSRPNAGDDEEPSVMMEPIVEINMDQNEQTEDAETSHTTSREEERLHPIEITRIMQPADIQPIANIPEEIVKKEQTDDANGQDNIDISEIENKIGLIGECTISVAN